MAETLYYSITVDLDSAHYSYDSYSWIERLILLMFHLLLYDPTTFLKHMNEINSIKSW